jgi:hypothetical protein
MRQLDGKFHKSSHFKVGMVTMRSIFIKLDTIIVVVIAHKGEKEQELTSKKAGESRNHQESHK